MNEACKEHSSGLREMVNACYKASGNVLPNFLAVNFYMVRLNFCTSLWMDKRKLHLKGQYE